VAKRWNIVLPIAAAVLVALSVGCAGGGDSSSTKDYQASVVEARDRVDSALANIPQAESEEDFLDRLDQAGAVAKDAADELDDTAPPAEFADETKRLVRHLRELSASLEGTAGQARDLGYDQFLLGANGLNFESWDKVNAVFADLRRQGVEVEPLARH
jgi:hypothetical protein